MPLTSSEIDFIVSNHKNYTPRELMTSLNKIRKRLGEPLISIDVFKKAYFYWCKKKVNEGETKHATAPELKKSPGRPPKISPDDRKTKAMQDYQNEAQSDGLSVSLADLVEGLDSEESTP